MSYAWAGKRLGAAAVIEKDQNCVLLVKHNYGKINWELPGGMVDAISAAAIKHALLLRHGE